MGKPLWSLSLALSGTLLLAIASSLQQAIAQAQPPCQPPSAGEYLLMVVHQAADTQATLQETLPRNATTTVCDYLGSTVTRVGGFTDLAVANSWAQYLSDLGGLQAFVTRPASDAPPAAILPSVPSAPSSSTATAEPFPTPSADGSAAADLVQPFPTPTQVSPVASATPSPLAVSPVTPMPSSSSSSVTPNSVAIANPAYSPRLLGAGYAVLVNYGHRPEVAAEVRQVVTGQVGVVAYEQRPYLLASYSSDLATAAAVLQQLSDRNFSVILVDGRRAILLTPTVANN